MLRIIVAIFFLVAGFLTAAAQRVAIVHVNIIPMTSDTILEDQLVIIDNGRIASIEPFNGQQLPANAIQVDGTGKYLIPGLADMHFHNETNVEDEFRLLIANGVTTAANMAERPGQDQIAIRRLADEQKILAPRYFTSGPYLTGTQLASEKNAVDVVRMHKTRGYDFIKLADNLPENIYSKLIEEAAKNKIPVLGHGQRKLSLEYSLKMSSLAHAEEFIYIFGDELRNDSAFISSALAKIKKSGIYITPTFSVFELIGRNIDEVRFNDMKQRPEMKYLPVAYFDQWTSDTSQYRGNKWMRSAEGKRWFDDAQRWLMRFVKLLGETGVPLMAGSDARGLDVNGFALQNELMLMRSAGLSNYEVLRSATVVPAMFLKNLDRRGTVEPGKDADLVLLSANPLADIANTRLIDGVVLKGKWMDRVALDGLLQQVEISVSTTR